VIPYKIGKSADLRQGDAIRVRGFPLGVMQAVSDGKIVNAYDRDQEQGWDHVDFVMDALLSEGNSGSPVLAVSCASRDLELVGLYHAGYKGHSALNVVIGIDQLVDLMKHKKRMPRALAVDAAGGLGPADRVRLLAAVQSSSLPLFDFGGTFYRVEARDKVLLYHLYGRQFPLDDRRTLVIEDQPKDGAFGEVTKMYVPEANTGTGPTEWRSWPLSALGVDEHDLLVHAVDAIHTQTLRALDYRATLSDLSSADSRKRGRDLSRAISRDAAATKDLATALGDMVDRLGVGHDTPAPPSGSVSEAPPPPPAPMPAPAPLTHVQ
jgi:serine protease Do